MVCYTITANTGANMRNIQDMVNWLERNVCSSDRIPGATYIPSITENMRKGRTPSYHNNFQRGDFGTKWQVHDQKALDSYITTKTKGRF
jgi:hypothetical protein